MGIIRVEHQVTGLCVCPRNISAIVVLHRGSSAMTDDVLSARGIVEHPIDESTAIHPVGAVSAGGGAACRRVPADGVHILQQLQQKRPLFQ